MARLLLLAQSIPSASSQSGLGLPAAFLMCAIGLMMCASHARQWRRCRYRPEPVTQIDMDARILTTRRVVQSGDHDKEQDPFSGPQVCVWQKNILMGEKCQLPDFSGIIVYDSTGNLVPPKTPQIAPSMKVQTSGSY